MVVVRLLLFSLALVDQRRPFFFSFCCCCGIYLSIPEVFFLGLFRFCVLFGGGDFISFGSRHDGFILACIS